MNRELNLSNIFFDEKDLMLTINKVKELIGFLEGFKSSLDNKNNLEIFIQNYSFLNSLIEMLSVYSSYKKLMDINNKENDKLIDLVDSIDDDAKNRLSFFGVELCNISYDNLIKYISESKVLQLNANYILNIYASKKHNTDTSIKDHEIKEIKKDYRNIVSNLDINYDDWYSKDDNVRKNVFDLSRDFYIANKSELSDCFINFINKSKEIARDKNYNSVLSYYLYEDKIDLEVFNSFMNSIKSNIDIFQNYLKYHQELFNNNYFDIEREISCNVKISFDDGYKYFMDSLTLLGEEYQIKVKEMFDKGLIDTLPKDNKAHKNTSSPVYLKDSVALVDYEDDLYSLSAMSHEIGHVMNDQYSKKNSFLESSSNILVTETIAIVNQIILHNYLLNNCKDINREVNDYYLDNIICPMFANSLSEEFKVKSFELENINENSLNELYFKLRKEYYGDYVYNDNERYNYFHNGRFFLGLYNYQYSFGYLLGHIIYNNLVNDKDYVKKYLKFISMGSTMNISELFKIIDIDLYDVNTYNMGFDLIRSNLKKSRQDKR